MKVPAQPEPNHGKVDPAPDRPTSAAGAARWRSADLLKGGVEAIIEHDGGEYRLRLTRQGKLILTK
jgi:hemin uptake protein HemP